MARGYPDFSPGAARSEQGEFLPSIAQAPVWFFDDFESPVLKWADIWALIALDSTPGFGIVESPVYNGSTCLKLTTPAGAANNIWRYIGPPPINNNLGISTFVKFSTLADFHATNADAFSVRYWQNSEGNAYNAYIVYNPNTGIWSISEDDGASYVAVLTYKVHADSFHYVKLIFNLTSSQYIKLYVDHNVVDLKSYNISTAVTPSDTRLRLFIALTSSAGKQAVAWIDDFKVTYGES